MDLTPRWGFDIDSVVGDLSTILERVAWEESGVRLARTQFTRFRLEECLPHPPALIMAWVTRALDPHWTMQMKPYPGAVEVLTDLAQRQRLVFVTARSEQEPIRTWLAQCLRDVSRDRILVEAVGHTEPKHPVIIRSGVSHFVEDRWEICEEISRHGIVPILFQQPWNAGRQGFATVGDWIQLRALMVNGGNGGQ